MGFLIFILIIVLLYYIGKFYLKYKIRTYFGNFGAQFEGQARRNTNKQSSTRRKKTNAKAQKQESTKKVFTKDEGEYVDFVEIKD